MAWPRTKNPRTKFVTVRFTDDESADIDWLKSHTNAKDRSTAVRDCVDRVIHAERKRAQRTKKTGQAG